MRGSRFAATALVMLAGIFAGACSGSNQPSSVATVQPGGGSADALPELSPVPLDEGERLRVVATTNIVADVVSNVGGDRIELVGLLPIGVDPHAYEPTPQDLRAVADADVIFANGVGLEAFLSELIENAGGDAPVIPLSAGLDLLEMVQEKGPDPHTWFDPSNVVVWVRNSERALAQLDPGNAEFYAANARAYVQKLEALDAWIREQVAQVPEDRRKIVTDHRVLGYFTRAYGFEMIGAVVEAFSAAAEPSAQELVVLENNIQQYGVPAVFVGRTVNPKLAARVADDTGIQLVPLYTGSLSEAGGEAGTYLDFMRYDVAAIVAALKSDLD